MINPRSPSLECICNVGFGMNLSCPVHSRPSQSLSSGAPEIGPGAYLRRLAERFDRLFSFDHSDARQAKADYDEAFHDAVHALKDLRQFAQIIAPTWTAAASPSSLGSPPMTVYEMLDYLRGEGIERIYKNSKGFWLHPKDGDGKIIYDSYRSAGPYVRLEEAIHVGARS